MTYPARPVTGKITSVSVSGKGSDLKPAENAREQPDAAKRTNTSISSGTALSTMTGEIGKTSSSEPLQPDLIKAIESDLCLDAYTSSKLSSRNRIAWFTQIAGNDRLTGSRINKAYEDIKNACEVGLSDSDRANDFCKHVDLVMAKIKQLSKEAREANSSASSLSSEEFATSLSESLEIVSRYIEDNISGLDKTRFEAADELNRCLKSAVDTIYTLKKEIPFFGTEKFTLPVTEDEQQTRSDYVEEFVYTRLCLSAVHDRSKSSEDNMLTWSEDMVSTLIEELKEQYISKSSKDNRLTLFEDMVSTGDKSKILPPLIEVLKEHYISKSSEDNMLTWFEDMVSTGDKSQIWPPLIEELKEHYIRSINEYRDDVGQYYLDIMDENYSGFGIQHPSDEDRFFHHVDSMMEQLASLKKQLPSKDSDASYYDEYVLPLAEPLAKIRAYIDTNICGTSKTFFSGTSAVTTRLESTREKLGRLISDASDSGEVGSALTLDASDSGEVGHALTLDALDSGEVTLKLTPQAQPSPPKPVHSLGENVSSASVMQDLHMHAYDSSDSPDDQRIKWFNSFVEGQAFDIGTGINDCYNAFRGAGPDQDVFQVLARILGPRVEIPAPSDVKEQSRILAGEEDRINFLGSIDALMSGLHRLSADEERVLRNTSFLKKVSGCLGDVIDNLDQILKAAERSEVVFPQNDQFDQACNALLILKLGLEDVQEEVSMLIKSRGIRPFITGLKYFAQQLKQKKP